MTSEVYIWIHLPGETTPTVAARLRIEAGVGTFRYSGLYQRKPDAVAFDPVETVLTSIPVRVPEDRNRGLPGVVRDASPDFWGRYAIGFFRDGGMSETDLLLKSPDDRVGALSFSTEPGLMPKTLGPSGFRTVDHLVEVAELARRQREERGGNAESDVDLTRRTLALAGYPHTSLGGAQAKATVVEDGRLWLAKIGKPESAFDLSRAEAAMLDLAGLCGLDAPKARTASIRTGIDALLVPRFDREIVEDGIRRTRFASALTLFGVDEGDMAGWSYPVLADILRKDGAPGSGQELYKRMVFNALIANEDDHPRNHGVIAVRGGWRMTPVYDLVPGPSASQDVRLAMAIGKDGRQATVENLKSESPRFGFESGDAERLIRTMAETVRANWEPALIERGVRTSERRHLSTAFVKAGLGLGTPSDDDGGSEPKRRRAMPSAQRTKRPVGRGRD